MAQVKIQVRFKKRTMGSLYHSLYFDVDEELMIDGDNVNQEYPFTNNIDNLVLVKTSYYPKVIIVTPRLYLRFTNWDTVEEAQKNLEDGNLLPPVDGMIGSPFMAKQKWVIDFGVRAMYKFPATNI